MRTAAFVVMSVMAATPALAQAPWDHNPPPGAPYGPVPGAAYVPGAYPPNYVPGAVAPYGIGSEAYRLRQIEAERRAYNRHEAARGHSSDPFANDQTPGSASSAGVANRGHAKSTSNVASSSGAASGPTSVAPDRGAPSAMRSGRTVSATTTTAGPPSPPPCARVAKGCSSK